MRRFSSQNGFTLIELLVVVTIIMLTMGGGIAAYLNLNDRQNTVNAGTQMQAFLRTAQKKARVGDKPVGVTCNHLDAYSVVTNAANLQLVLLQANCNTGDFTVDSFTLPNGVYVQTAFTLRFKVLEGGVINAGGGASPWTVTIANPNTVNPKYTYAFTVGQGGDVSDGVASKLY